MQCVTRCSLDSNCGAIKWEEDLLKCVMYKKDGLCLADGNPNELNLMTEDSSICSFLCSGKLEFVD